MATETGHQCLDKMTGESACLGSVQTKGYCSKQCSKQLRFGPKSETIQSGISYQPDGRLVQIARWHVSHGYEPEQAFPWPLRGRQLQFFTVIRSKNGIRNFEVLRSSKTSAIELLWVQHVCPTSSQSILHLMATPELELRRQLVTAGHLRTFTSADHVLRQEVQTETLLETDDESK